MDIGSVIDAAVAHGGGEKEVGSGELNGWWDSIYDFGDFMWLSVTPVKLAGDRAEYDVIKPLHKN